MRSNLQIFCENWEALLKEDPSLKKEQVFLQSPELYELLVPKSRERYEGVRRNFFGFAEWRHQVEDNIFFNLIEQDKLLVEPEKMISYLERLIDLLEKDDQSFPLLYALRDPDEGVPGMVLKKFQRDHDAAASSGSAGILPASSGSSTTDAGERPALPGVFQHTASPLVFEYELGDAQIEAGYEHCLADVHGVWHDLRRQSSYESEDPAGSKKHLLIVTQSIEKAFGPLLRRILSVAKIAQGKSVLLRLVAHHRKDDMVQPAAKVEDSKDVESKSDEEQIKLYMKMVDEIPIPTPDEEEDLVRKIELFGEEGAAARKRLAQGYFRLVVSLATKHRGKGVRLLNLIPQANHALVRAVERYDFASGIPFSNYATWRIESDLQSCLGEGENFDAIPQTMVDKLEQAKCLSEKLKKKKGRRPSERELAEAMGIDVQELRRLFEQV